MNIVCVFWLLINGGYFAFTEALGNAGLRMLLQNQLNQDLIRNLGTRYEIVHPIQISQYWSKGVSTRDSSVDGRITHLQKTSFVIDTFGYKLHLDLELNTNLFAPTFVQLIYSEEELPIAIKELPENCFYQATIRNYPDGTAAFYTCSGVRGIILLDGKMFFLQPLHGNLSETHPHLLYHVAQDELLKCDNTEIVESLVENMLHVPPNEDVALREKFIEVALVLDQSLPHVILIGRRNLYTSKFNIETAEIAGSALCHKILELKPITLEGKIYPLSQEFAIEKYSSIQEAITTSIEIINYADMIFKPLNTSLSLVYGELWAKNRIEITNNISSTLKKFKEYAAQRMSRFSIDTAHLLSGSDFNDEQNGIAFLDSVCTANGVSLTKVNNIFLPYISANILAHLIGHNLGMKHDHKHCNCSGHSNCIMANNVPHYESILFSDCSIRDYFQTLNKGFGACLFNMPTLRKAVCGNGIVEESEECDCGTMEECMKLDPCCDPATCKLIMHAECSVGPCCKNCKLLSPDHLCRSSRGECDIPEFCDGKIGQCPEDLFKRNGAVCSSGLGYCFEGLCPVLRNQCQDIWGGDSKFASRSCFERLNILGTPNGNCGFDDKSEIQKCAIENVYCGALQCSEGEKAPVSSETLPINFVVYKMNADGAIHECKALTLSLFDKKHGIIKEGTKCGYKKLCLNHTCTKIRDIVHGKCPHEDIQNTCSSHGVCTNKNTCVCEEGWKGDDCGIVDEEWKLGKGSAGYHDSSEDSNISPHLGNTELKLSPKLAFTVLVSSVIVGLTLVIIVLLFLFYRNPEPPKKVKKSERGKRGH